MDFSNLTLQLDLDNCDILSQTDSQLSDRDADILEQQVRHLTSKNAFGVLNPNEFLRKTSSSRTLEGLKLTVEERFKSA